LYPLMLLPVRRASLTPRYCAVHWIFKKPFSVATQVYLAYGLLQHVLPVGGVEVRSERRVHPAEAAAGEALVLADQPPAELATTRRFCCMGADVASSHKLGRAGVAANVVIG